LAHAGIFSSVPQLSYEVDGKEEDMDLFSQLDGVQPPIVVELLKEFHQWFIGLKNKWTQTFLEVDSSHSIMVKDLQMTHKHFIGLKTKISRLEDAQQQHILQTVSQLESLSKEIQESATSHATLSVDLHQLHQNFEAMQTLISSSNEELDLRLYDLASSFTTLHMKLSSADRSIKEFDKRFSIIFPILKNMKHQVFTTTIHRLHNFNTSFKNWATR
jgi:uncharacterized phage infection (PIP) family protein YhgE